MTSMPHSDAFITGLIQQQIPVNCFLTNGLKLTGYVLQQDKTTLLLGGRAQMLVYKHLVSTINALKAIDITEQNSS